VTDLAAVGVLLIAMGLAAVFASVLLGDEGGRPEVRGGGVVMVGPVPIVFGSDAKWASVAIALAAVLMLLYFLGALR
jgi:uncharacterized protein (TIGR00304 family)